MRLKFFFLKWLEYKERTVEGKYYSIRNPLTLLGKSGRIELTDGTSFQFDSSNKREILNIVYFLLNTGTIIGNSEGQWRYDKNTGVIETPDGIKFSSHLFDPTIFTETFLNDIHYSEGLYDKVVVQAGGFVGDTALYYANKGAKVYSFEPDPNSYKQALENIHLNPNLEKNIYMGNYAMGRDETLDFPINELGGGGNSVFKQNSNKTTKIKSLSISTILNDFKIKSPYLLDLDIKGSEYDIINDEAIGMFNKVRIEYSPYLFLSESKSVHTLKRKLSEYGFRNHRIYKHNNLKYDLLYHGTLEVSK